MQVASLDFSSYVGRIAIGRVFRGDIMTGVDYTLCKRDGKVKKVRVKELYVFEGLGRLKTETIDSPGQARGSYCYSFMRS